MDEIYNSLLNKFIKDNINQIELTSLGFIIPKCHISKLAILIECVENYDIFTEEDKLNLKKLINKYI